MRVEHEGSVPSRFTDSPHKKPFPCTRRKRTLHLLFYTGHIMCYLQARKKTIDSDTSLEYQSGPLFQSEGFLTFRFSPSVIVEVGCACD